MLLFGHGKNWDPGPTSCWESEVKLENVAEGGDEITITRGREEDVWPELNNALICLTWTGFVGQISLERLWERQAGSALHSLNMESVKVSSENRHKEEGVKKRQKMEALLQGTPLFSSHSCCNGLWSKGES